MVPKATARRLGRGPTTILRELRRNSGKAGQQCGPPYPPGSYHFYAGGPSGTPSGRQAAGPSRDGAWHSAVGVRPQAFAPELEPRPDCQHTGSSQPVQLSYETIYNSLYAMPRRQLRSEVMNLMRRRHYVPVGQQGPAKTASSRMDLIDQRPAEAKHRSIPGHCGGDVSIGKGIRFPNRRARGLQVLVPGNGQTRFDPDPITWPQPLLDPAPLLIASCVAPSASIKARKCATIGACNTVLASALTSHIHTPHGNAESGKTPTELLRHHFSKGTYLSVFSQDQFDDIAWKMNARIRKSLGWKAPAEVFLPEGAFDFVEYWPFISRPLHLGLESAVPIVGRS